MAVFAYETQDGKIVLLEWDSSMPDWVNLYYPDGECFSCFSTRTMLLDLSGYSEGSYNLPATVDADPYFWIHSPESYVSLGDFGLEELVPDFDVEVYERDNDFGCEGQWDEWGISKIIQVRGWRTPTNSIDFDQGWEIGGTVIFDPPTGGATTVGYFNLFAASGMVRTEDPFETIYGVKVTLYWYHTYISGVHRDQVDLSFNWPCTTEESPGLITIYDMESDSLPWAEYGALCFAGIFTITMAYRDKTLTIHVTSPTLDIDYTYERKPCFPFFCRCDAIIDDDIENPYRSGSGVAGSTLGPSTRTYWSDWWVLP